LFIAKTEAYFKMLAFDGTAVAGFGAAAGNDAIRFEGAGEYFEVKDCNINGFNKGIVANTNVELWVFETDLNNCVTSGIEIAAGSTKYVTLKVSEVDFISCAKGINLASGDSATISILNSTFYNSTGGTGVHYEPANFTRFASMFITNNAWNGTGSFFNGFDFSRSDGRDARAFVQNNAGDPNRNPNCYITLLNSTATTTLTIANVWYKANWTPIAASVNTTKWTVANASGNVNRITYQPTNKRSGYFIISGNILCNNANRTISIAIFKNGISINKHGEITVRTGSTAGTPTVFSTIVFLPEISFGEYFEIGISSTVSGDVVTLQDLQWFVESK